MLYNKRHEIESMRQEAIDLALTPPDFNRELPPALESIKQTVVWVPFNERRALVQGLPRHVQDTLLKDLDDPLRHSSLARMLIEAMHVDAVFYLTATVPLTEIDRRQMERGSLYRLEVGKDNVGKLIPRTLYLPRFLFDWADFKDLFIPGTLEIPINAYLYKRWVYYATM